MTWAAGKDELLRRTVEDQEVRTELIRCGFIEIPPPDDPRRARFDELGDEMKRIDADNSAWLAEMLEEHGWPRRSEVGDEAAQAAWLLAQHADRDPDFQRRCLNLMRALPPEEAHLVQVAMLTDRVMLKDDGVQRYGTQWTFADGDWEPQPLEDPDKVDELRRDVGLGPLSEYRHVIAENHGKSSFLQRDRPSEGDDS